ncbi:MAG: phosphoprotein phosphatase [Deltaproteobacteria bacterium HGW-Deltaproteobacteria-14]|jgi:serine/threonine protein phosphatase PrpC|nr:MAG: phosphoprotein phosphatase [Deltaproteobacteria bacterium HGW-Deltaproteobacteria-14]
MTVTFGARTDVGRVRTRNEDNYLVDRKLKLYVVCDGMGGHQSGEVASATAVNVVRETLVKRRGVIDSYGYGDGRHDMNDVMALVEDAVHEANLRIHERGHHNASQRGMGTTLSLLLLVRDTGFVAHVGDTRIYRKRGERVTQLTEDHSLVNEMARTMNVAAETFDDRLKNAITRAVGVHPVVEVDAQAFELQPGDRFLLCSDGLHGAISATEVADMLALEDPEVCVRELVEAANAAGGRDNITALVVQVAGAPAPIDADEREALLDGLKGVPLFHGLSSLELRRILEGARRQTLDAGERLVEQGHVQDALCVVVGGHLQVLRNGISVARIGPGSHFGEEALLHESLSLCTVRASSDAAASVLQLTGPSFEELRTTAPTVALKLAVAAAASLARRLVAMSPQLSDPRPLYLEPVVATRSSARPRPTGRLRADTLTSAARPVAEPRPRALAARVSPAATLPAPQAPDLGDDVLRGASSPPPAPQPPPLPLEPDGGAGEPE